MRLNAPGNGQGRVIRLRDFLTAQDVQLLHLGLFDDPEESYLRSGSFGSATSDQIRQRIKNVKGQKITRIIDAVEPFDSTTWQAAWSHFMALSAGTHPWPDANHRTAMLGFAKAVYQAWGTILWMHDDDAVQMTQTSKAMRDAARRAQAGRTRYYTLAELQDAMHPYRQLFRHYQTRVHLRFPQ